MKLRSHPLVVPLQSIFVDNRVTFLQMPFYTKGDLRRWDEPSRCVDYISAVWQTSCCLQSKIVILGSVKAW